METVSSYGVKEIHAYATSAIRSADNGSEFVAEVKRKFNFDINVISGDEEADLIYRGITESVDFNDEKQRQGIFLKVRTSVLPHILKRERVRILFSCNCFLVEALHEKETLNSFRYGFLGFWQGICNVVVC